VQDSLFKRSLLQGWLKLLDWCEKVNDTSVTNESSFVVFVRSNESNVSELERIDVLVSLCCVDVTISEGIVRSNLIDRLLKTWALWHWPVIALIFNDRID
jgi:hypothetical protein